MSETVDAKVDALLDRALATGKYGEIKDRLAKDPSDFINEKPSQHEVDVLTRLKAGGTLFHTKNEDGKKIDTPVAVAVRIPTDSPSSPQLTLLEFANGVSLVLEPYSDDAQTTFEYNARKF